MFLAPLQANAYTRHTVMHFQPTLASAEYAPQLARCRFERLLAKRRNVHSEKLPSSLLQAQVEYAWRASAFMLALLGAVLEPQQVGEFLKTTGSFWNICLNC